MAINVLSDSFKNTGTISKADKISGGVEQSVTQLKDNLSSAGNRYDRIIKSGSELPTDCTLQQT